MAPTAKAPGDSHHEPNPDSRVAHSSDTSVAVHAPPPAAAGWAAVRRATRIALEQMGLSRSLRTLARVNKRDGFDCPSCAWPEGDHRHHIEFCENGAKAVAWEATRKQVGPEFFAAHSLDDLRGRTDRWLESQGRLVHPMYAGPDDDHYRPIEWAAAFDLIADTLRLVGSPNEAVFYTSGRTSNEAAFLYQLFARRFGTNNLPDCSNMCHESSGVALSQVIGIGKGTVTHADITDHADLIVIVGQNPGTNHPRMLTALETAKKRGAKIVAINPLAEVGLVRFRNPQRASGLVGAGTALADLHLPVRVGGDLALFQAVNRKLVDLEAAAPGTVLDSGFIDAHCEGFEDAAAAWRRLDLPATIELSGLSHELIDHFVELVAASRSIVLCWAMGITQHRDAVATIREFVNFLLLRGNIGRPGAGVCPVRGHSNVQGDRTMGINERPPAAFLDRLAAEFAFSPPREPGYDVVQAIRAMRDGRVRFFMTLGGNFIPAAPDTDVTAAAVARCELTVHVTTKLNRTHLHPGRESLLLPTLGRTDLDVTAAGKQAVTVEDSMGMVHASHGRLQPASPELRSEVAILSALGARMFGPHDVVEWQRLGGDNRLIRERISRVVPGFDDFEKRIAAGGFALPNGPRDSRTFTTASSRARFTVNPLDPLVVPAGHLLLQTMRSHGQFNTTVYSDDDHYRGVFGGRRVVFVNPDDLDDAGIPADSPVDIVSVWDDGERRVRGFTTVAYATPRGCAAAYFPEANPLVPLDSTAHESGTPASKSVVVRLERSTLHD